MKLAHAAERAAERMHVGLSWADLGAMCAKIKRGEGVRLNDRKAGGQQWIVTYKGKAFRVVYDATLNTICTVLNPIGKRRKQTR